MRILRMVAVAAVLAFQVCSFAGQDPLAAGFSTPPDIAKPWVYWFWLNGNITPDGIRGLPCDAARWTEKTAPDTIRAMAASRFARQQGTRLGVHRLTLTFSHPVGEGYLAGAPDTLVTTRKARCLIDRMGYLVRCYPVLRG